MCGIAGIVRFDGQAADEQALGRMSAALRHRGPDDDATWVRGPVGLAHRRLSIIDLGGSRQPMVSADQRHVLVFNGEILNYQRLRDDTGYPYRTAGDTEVILAQHAAHGMDAPRRLGGQFAYALFDTVEQSLLLVRDRMGILPLFWYHDSTQVVYASEVTALLAGLPARPELDPTALTSYLSGRSVPAPDTLLMGVRKLRPGHVLTVDRLGTCHETAYWQPEALTNDHPLTADEAVNELDARLDNAVQRALVADVPVGAYLSGGVDSSLVVSKVVRQSGHEGVHTFCADFGDPRVDESPHAARVSELFGTRHHQVSVRPDDFVELWHWLSVHRGAPLSEPADVAVYRLAQAAKEHVKVVLSGEGSDELFGGYPKYRYAAATAAVGVIPAVLRGPALTALERRLPSAGRRMGVALRALAEPTFEDRVRGWFAPFTSRERADLVGMAEPPRPRRTRGVSPLRAMLLEDLRSWLPDNLLERGDRMTMAASIELRPPFLDRDVVDFALALPPRLLIRSGQGKWLVKQVAHRYLPSDIVDRKKVGFRVPLNTWFRGGLRDHAWDLVSSAESVTQRFLDKGSVTRLFADHDRGRRDESIRIWTLASLEVWYASLAAGVPAPLSTPSG